jgi:hypothetical protein
MELTYVTIVVIASMIFVLAGMVGYLYWQQTHMLSHMQSLAMAVSMLHEPPQVPQTPEEAEEEEEDDRVSVEEDEKVETVEGPPKEDAEVDVDDLQGKTASELRDLLSKKGIPFGKRDSKSVLIQLLKATG